MVGVSTKDGTSRVIGGSGGPGILPGKRRALTCVVGCSVAPTG